MEQLIGHEWARSLLDACVANDRVPHALLLTGLPNIGKTTLARYFAQALNCKEDRGSRPCGECLSCRKIHNGSHPDVVFLDERGERIIIDNVRDLQQQVSLTPYEGLWRVAVLVDFERATAEAANALLKTLEEPATQVVLILTCTEADSLLPTVVSRCQVLSLRPLPTEQVERTLVTHWNADAGTADLVARLSGGRIGWAITAIQDPTVRQRRETALDEMVGLFVKNRVERMSYAAQLCSKEPLARDTLGYWLSWWHDMLTIQGGADQSVVNVDQLTGLRHWAELITLGDAKRMVEQVTFVIRAFDQNVNKPLAMEALVLGFPR